jgi:hypothetical protein
MKKTYTGGCQCGKVRYEAQAEIGDVITAIAHDAANLAVAICRC